MDIAITDLEQAINYWRVQKPSHGEEHALSPEVSTLATVYAMMIWQGSDRLALAAIAPDARSLIEAAQAQRGISAA